MNIKFEVKMTKKAMFDFMLYIRLSHTDYIIPNLWKQVVTAHSRFRKTLSFLNLYLYFIYACAIMCSNEQGNSSG